MERDEEQNNIVPTPDKDSLEQRLLRANYQAQIWYNFANHDAPTTSWIHTKRFIGIIKTIYRRSMPKFVERFGP